MLPDQAISGDFRWNDYVKGTIAFLKRDQANLHMSRARLAEKAQRNKANLRVLDKLLERFDRDYAEAIR